MYSEQQLTASAGSLILSVSMLYSVEADAARNRIDCVGTVY